MKALRSLKPYRIQLFVFAAILTQGCGIKGSSTTCGTGVAQITVTDNIVRRDCGCQETGTQSFTGQNLICTVPVSTRLYIYYTNIQNPHQLTFSTMAIGTLSNHDPATDGDNNPIDAITFTTTSTGITFVDSYTGNGGKFIVQ